MERLKISESRRVRGLGAKQVAALVDEFSSRASRHLRPGPRPAHDARRGEPSSRCLGLTVLAGPTAVGKGTLTRLGARAPPRDLDLRLGDDAPRRPGEEDGVHYHFVSDDEFDRLVAEDELLEWAVVHRRARYGTPRARR